MSSEEGEHIRALGEGLQNIGEMMFEATGEISVLACAIVALVRSHPEPAKFAAEFFRAWQLVGSPLGLVEDGAPARDGIESVLAMIEEACPVPLNVRPGR